MQESRPKKDFPEKISSEEYERLKKISERIREKNLGLSSSLYLLIILTPATLVGWMLGFVFQSLMIFLLQHHLLDFLLWLPSLPLQVFGFFVLFIIVLTLFSVLPIVYTILYTLSALRKYLAFPSDEESIFAECFIIANHLRKNERIEAKKEVGSLLGFLTR